MVRFASIPKYEAYTDSGVMWLDKIPSHWSVEKSQWLFKLRRERARKGDKQLTASQKYGMISQQIFMELERRRVTQVEFNAEILKHVETNDFVISMRSFQGGIEYCQEAGCVSSAYVPLIPDKYVYSPFFKYLLKSQRYIEALQSTSNLVRDGQALRYENFRMVDLPVVPIEEQTAIANFLDRKTAQIDEAVAIKEKQIVLLKERKKIIIQKAITQGLDPNAPMKDSGVDWIGQIPEHWEMLPLKRLAKLSPKVEVENRNSADSACFLPMEKVSANGEIECDVMMPIKKVSQGFTVFNRGDVIVAKITPCFENGKSAYLKTISTNFGFGSTEFHVLRSFGRINGEFLYFVVRSNLFLKAGEALMTGSAGQKRVPSSFVANFPIALPPEYEQKEIVAYIEGLFEKIEEATTLQRQHIEKLKEYKTTLINSAVTGKIKVA